VNETDEVEGTAAKIDRIIAAEHARHSRRQVRI
jgi:hypothetical protein